MNVRPVPAIEAIPPRIGPQSAPPIARPNAVPISAPRRPGGAAATSQASAPVHENELASPCAKRARSSCQTESAKPNAVLVSAMQQRPTITVGLTPARAATIPLGIAPTSAPAG